MSLPFGLHWKCPHWPNGCEGGWYGKEQTACRNDVAGWALFRKVAEIMKPTMKKPTSLPSQEEPVSKWVDGDFEKEWPYLSAFMSSTSWDDGTIRETGTLLLFVQEGYLKACINDRALDRSAFVTGPSINCLFDLVEAGLEQDSLDWRKRRRA